MCCWRWRRSRRTVQQMRRSLPGFPAEIRDLTCRSRPHTSPASQSRPVNSISSTTGTNAATRTIAGPAPVGSPSPAVRPALGRAAGRRVSGSPRPLPARSARPPDWTRRPGPGQPANLRRTVRHVHGRTARLRGHRRVVNADRRQQRTLPDAHAHGPEPQAQRHAVCRRLDRRGTLPPAPAESRRAACGW